MPVSCSDKTDRQGEKSENYDCKRKGDLWVLLVVNILYLSEHTRSFMEVINIFSPDLRLVLFFLRPVLRVITRPKTRLIQFIWTVFATPLFCLCPKEKAICLNYWAPIIASVQDVWQTVVAMATRRNNQNWSEHKKIWIRLAEMKQSKIIGSFEVSLAQLTRKHNTLGELHI